MQHRIFVFIVLGGYLSWGSLAQSSETRILELLSGGALQLETQVAVPKPPSGDQAPALGGEQETVFSRLKKAEERNIVDKAFPLMEA